MNKIKQMMVAVVASAIAVLTNVVFAESLNLGGVDKTVTDVAELAGYDGVTNSSGGDPVTLTFNVATDMAYAGTISGNIKVVKEGAGMLTLSADNSYTGGTQINEGKLAGTSNNPFGSDHANNPIYVNTDLTDGRATATDTSTAVVFAKAGTSASAPQTYGYPITCSAWSNHGGRPGGTGTGSGTLYNIALAENNIKLTGDITGGDISIRCGTIGSNWNANPVGKNNPAISGNITALGGSLALSSRAASFALSGVVKVGAVYQPIAADYPTPATLSNAGNEIGWYDCGRYNSGGKVTISAAGAIGGAVLISTTAYFAKTGNNTSQSFTLGDYDQTINYPTIDYFTPRLPSASVGMDTPHRILCDKTLTMAATATATNDWCFSYDKLANRSAASLVWDPQGDFWLYNVSRAHLIGGTITVNRGGFAMDENCSFSNVTAITVGAGAVFSNDTSVAESLKSLTALTLGAGAKVYLPADALTMGAVTLSIASDAEVVFPEGTESVTFSDIMIGGKYLAAGSYSASGEWVRVIPQIKNVATVVNNKTAGNVETEEATWDAGGADTLLHTKENWAGDTTPDFSSMPVEVTFSSGSRATADAKTLIGSIALAAPGDFTIDASGDGAIRLSGGITAADDEVSAHEYLVTAPLMLDAGQSWAFGTNANFTLAGPVSTPENTPITTEVSSYQTLRFVGTGETGYTGTWSFPNVRYPAESSSYYGTCILASGLNPFGGEGAVVSIAGGLQNGEKLNSGALIYNGYQNALILSNATVAATLAFPYSTREDRYGVWLYAAPSSTNVVSGAVTNAMRIIIGENAQLTFNGPVSIHANDMSTDQSLCFQFSYEGGTEATKTSVVRFNGCVTFPTGSKKESDMAQMSYATYCFNAPSNVVDRVGGGNYFTIETGADYAFAEGRTAVLFRYNGPSYLKLNGHSQHIGSINSGHANTEISSTAPATLRVNQTNDVVYAGFVSSNIVFVKEGSAQLGFSKADALKGAVRVVAGTLAPEAGALATSAQLAFEGGTLSLPAGETVVHRVDYLEDGELKSLPKGTYSAGDGSKIGSYLTGSGTLRVRTSDVVSSGLLIFVR